MSSSRSTNPLMSHSLTVARSLVGVKEDPPGSNWGSEIAAFLGSVGLKIPAPWCAAFVYYVVDKAARELDLQNPFAEISLKAYTPDWLKWANKHCEKLTGRGALKLIREGRPAFGAAAKGTNSADASAAPVLAPGMIFLLFYPRLKRVGHIGFIAGAPDRSGRIPTIEGNTDTSGSRTGGGVFKRSRKLAGIHRLIWY